MDDLNDYLIIKNKEPFKKRNLDYIDDKEKNNIINSEKEPDKTIIPMDDPHIEIDKQDPLDKDPDDQIDPHKNPQILN